MLGLIKDIAEANPQVASVDVGNEMEFDVKKYEQFPRVFIRTNNSKYAGRWTYGMTILVLDLVNNDAADRIDSQTRCHAIAVDLVSQLNYKQMVNPLDVELVPLVNYQDTVTAGWAIEAEVFTELGLGCYEVGD